MRGLCVLDDTRLSFRAKGMFLFLAVKFHGPFTFKQMRKRFVNGSLILAAVLHRLCSTGYVKRIGNRQFLVPAEYRIKG